MYVDKQNKISMNMVYEEQLHLQSATLSHDCIALTFCEFVSPNFYKEIFLNNLWSQKPQTSFTRLNLIDVPTNKTIKITNED